MKEFFGARANRFQHAQEPVHVQKLTRDELDLTQELADFVIDQQQRFVVIQAFNLVAVYLSYRSQGSSRGLTGITVTEICEQVLAMGRLLGRMGAITNVDPSRIVEQVGDTLKTHEAWLGREKNGEISIKKPVINTNAIQSVRFKAHRLGDDTMQECLPLVGLQLYVNPCLYWTAMPALVLAAVKRLHYDRSTVQLVTVEALRKEVFSLRQIFAAEFVFIPSKAQLDFDATLNQLQDFNLVQINGASGVVEGVREQRFADVLMTSITPYLWTYYQVARTIAQFFPSGPFTENACLVKVQSFVEEQLRRKHRHVHPYCLSLEAISTALGQMTKMGVLAREKREDGSALLLANLPELHQIHCHLHHLCTAIDFTYVGGEGESLLAKAKL